MAQQMSPLDNLDNNYLEQRSVPLLQFQDINKLPDKTNIPITIKGNQYTLALEKKSNRGENFKIIIQGKHGKFTELNASPVNTFRGTIIQLPNHKVTAVVTSEGVPIEIGTPSGNIIEIVSKLAQGISSKGKHSLHIKRKEAEQNYVVNCGVQHKKDHTISHKHTTPVTNKVLAGETVKQAEIAFDVAYNTYKNRYGSNTTAITNNINVFYGTIE